MDFKLMYITNRPDIASLAEEVGVDWIFIDLEVNGKKERQKGKDTFVSHHEFSDIAGIRKVITKSEILVRINPPNEHTNDEIERVISAGADIIMLPFFKTLADVRNFIKTVDKRAKTVLLVETKEAVESLESIVKCPGIDYIHIGLNDLTISYQNSFLFEPLASGLVEDIIDVIKPSNIQYGIGGIARLEAGLVPGKKILIEHQRLGSKMAILSRSFCHVNDATCLCDVEDLFRNEVKKIRDAIEKYKTFELDELESNRVDVVNSVTQIVNKK